MIIIYHNKSKVTDIVSAGMKSIPTQVNRNVVAVLLDFADQYEAEILVWCHENQRNHLNVDAIEDLFHHDKFLFSFNPSSANYFDRELGYVENSAFIKINKEVRYGTWQTSSQVGAIHSSVLKACRSNLIIEKSFDYFLNSLAKRAIVFGLFCYSEPQLLKDKSVGKEEKSANLYQLLSLPSSITGFVGFFFCSSIY